MGLYCGIDLHSNNGVYAVTDGEDRLLFRRRLPNDLAVVLRTLEPFREQLEAVAVESTYNWYWLVDGLQAHGYPMRLANPAKMEQYEGLKQTDDNTDASFLAHLLRLGILPQGYIYPAEDRPVRDLLRRRMLLVHQRTALILSLQGMFCREIGSTPSWRKIVQEDAEALCQRFGSQQELGFIATEQVEVIRFLARKIRLFEKRALEKATLRTSYEKLLTMPGVGKVLGLTIMFETGQISRFAKVGNYTSYCRGVSAKRLSNGKKKGENNRKSGNAYLAWAFVEAAHHAMRVCPQALKFYERKKAKTNGAVATKALASKWSKAAYYILRRQEAFDLKRVFG